VEISSLAELRPRHVWDIVDDAFDLYRERFALFGSIAAAIYVPALVVTNLYLTSQYTAKLRAAQSVTTDPFALVSVASENYLLILPLFGLAYVLQLGATAGAVDDILKGESPTLKTALGKMARRLFPLLGAALIVAIVVGLSTCGVWVGLPLFAVALYSFFAQAVMVENKGLFKAERRSRDLSGSHYPKALGMLCLLLLIGSLLGFGLAGVVSMGYEFLPRFGGDVYAREQQRFVVNLVSGSLIALLLAPLPGIATTLLYYDIRVRREGLDIESEAARRGVALAPDPFGGVLNPKVPKQKSGRKGPP
jgi:hypothetical protein